MGHREAGTCEVVLCRQGITSLRRDSARPDDGNRPVLHDLVPPDEVSSGQVHWNEKVNELCH